MTTISGLITGFQQFKRQYFGDDNALYAQLKQAQPAKIMMIGCCDSRADPAILTQCDPGELFTLRNVANLVAPSDKPCRSTSAALEFAVNSLEVAHIIVMGHSDCGGIKVLWGGGEPDNFSQFIHPWVSVAQPAKTWVQYEFKGASTKEKLTACEQRSIVQSLTNLMTFLFVREQLEAGKLSIHGWYFDITSGELLCFNVVSGKFEPMCHLYKGDTLF